MQHGNTKTPNTHHDWRRNSFVRTQIATKTHFLQTKPPFLTGNCYLRKQLVSHQQLCIPYRMLSRQVARLSVGDSYFCTRTEEEGDSSHLSACIWCYHNDYKRWLAAVLAFLTTDLYPIVDYSQVPPKQCRLDALDLQHLLSLVLLCILAVYMLSSIVYLFVLSSINCVSLSPSCPHFIRFSVPLLYSKEFCPKYDNKLLLFYYVFLS